MNKYQNGKIYALRSYKTETIYIGSTIKKLKHRLSAHKTDYNDGKPLTSSELIKYDDCYIYLLLKYPCNSRKELERKEGMFIKVMECCNKYVAGRTKKEYRALWNVNNKDKVKEYNRQNYLKNRIIKPKLTIEELHI